MPKLCGRSKCGAGQQRQRKEGAIGLSLGLHLFSRSKFLLSQRTSRVHIQAKSLLRLWKKSPMHSGCAHYMTQRYAKDMTLPRGQLCHQSPPSPLRRTWYIRFSWMDPHWCTPTVFALSTADKAHLTNDCRRWSSGIDSVVQTSLSRLSCLTDSTCARHCGLSLSLLKSSLVILLRCHSMWSFLITPRSG
jgi:hypothetical protein